jgi:hypothetical protein
MNLRLLVPILATAIGYLSTPPSGPEPPACLRYEPDTIEIQGLLRRHVFPGRPNYESVKAGDEAESGFYLHLSKPICFTADSTDPVNETLPAVDFIQLNLDSVGYSRLRPFLGHVVRLRGRAYGAHTGHHHAPVVLWFDSGPL